MQEKWLTAPACRWENGHRYDSPQSSHRGFGWGNRAIFERHMVFLRVPSSLRNFGGETKILRGTAGVFAWTVLIFRDSHLCVDLSRDYRGMAQGF